MSGRVFLAVRDRECPRWSEVPRGLARPRLALRRTVALAERLLTVVWPAHGLEVPPLAGAALERGDDVVGGSRRTCAPRHLADREGPAPAEGHPVPRAVEVGTGRAA